MGSFQNIGNLAATITADNKQFMSAFNQVADKVDDTTNKVSVSTRNLAAGFDRMALTTVIGSRAFAALHREIVDVIQNIDDIPNVPADTLESVHQLRYALESSNGALRQAAATFAGWFAKLGTGIGYGLGAMVYGLDSAAEGFRKLNDEAAIFSKYTFDSKAIKSAQEQLRKENISGSLLGSSTADTITKLNAEAARLNAEAAAIPSLPQGKPAEYYRTLAAAMEVTNRAKAEELNLSKQLRDVDERLRQTEGALYGATLPDQERLVGLKAREFDLKQQILELDQKANKSAEDQARLIELKKDLVKVEQGEIPLIREQQRQWIQLGEKITSAFEDAVFSGGKLSDTLRGLAQDLLRIGFNAGVTRPLGEALGKAMSTSALGNGIFKTVGSFLGFKAEGGPVDSGRPYVVGERGPELFLPRSSGSIVPNHAIASANGHAAGTYYIDARGADRSGLAQLAAAIRALDGSIEYRAVAAVIKYKRGGPSSAFA